MRIPRLVSWNLPMGRDLHICMVDHVVGGKIWPSAEVLCDYLVSRRSNLFAEQGTKVCELGSGTGVVGLFTAAVFDASVTLTEYCPPKCAVVEGVGYTPEGDLDLLDQERIDLLLRLLNENLERNSCLFTEAPVVAELDWNRPDQIEAVKANNDDGFDVILASDVTYVTSLHHPLSKTISMLLGTNPSKCALVAHQQRILNLRAQDSQIESFYDALQNEGLMVEKVHETRNNQSTLPLNPVSILEIRHAP